MTDQSEIKVPSSIISYEIEATLVPCPFRPKSLRYLQFSFLRRGRRNFLRREECKERFSMNSLFASNITYSFQIFALTLFLVIYNEFAKRGFSPEKRLVPFYFPLFHLFVFTK